MNRRTPNARTRTTSTKAVASRGFSKWPRAASIWSSPIRPSISATSTTSTTTPAAAEEYLDWTRKWIGGVKRALKPNGTFWLAIGDEYAAELKLIAQAEFGFVCRSWVIWYYTFGVNCVRGFSRSHTHLFHFVCDPTGLHLQRRQSGRAGALGAAVGLCRHAGEPQRPPARQHLDPASARPARRLSPRARHLVLSPRGRHVQGARRVPRLPDAGAVAGPDHPLRVRIRWTWCSIRSAAAARPSAWRRSWGGSGWASSCRRTTCKGFRPA